MILRLPLYIVPETREMGRIDESVMYPYSQDVLLVGIELQIEREKWRLIDVSWCVQDQSQLEHTRYYFGYVGVSQRAMLFGRKVFTGYVLLESHYDEKIKDYDELYEMWGIYQWAYKGNLSDAGKYRLALKMLWRHWAHKKKEDKKLRRRRQLYDVQLSKEKRLFNNQFREIARWVWA